MVKAYIQLESYDDVMKFHKAASACRYDLKIQKDADVINAKSLMGLLCVGTGRVISLIAKCNDRGDVINKFGDFIVNGF